MYWPRGDVGLAQHPGQGELRECEPGLLSERPQRLDRSQHSGLEPGGAEEAQRMVAEKLDAGLALQALAVTGGLGWTPQAVATKTLAHYRKRVRAN